VFLGFIPFLRSAVTKTVILREREMELRLNFCWGFDPLVIHSHWNEMKQKKKIPRCFPGRLRGLPPGQRTKSKLKS
jgi:hypothetical protein